MYLSTFRGNLLLPSSVLSALKMQAARTFRPLVPFSQSVLLNIAEGQEINKNA
jgi:hypothetical protein